MLTRFSLLALALALAGCSSPDKSTDAAPPPPKASAADASSIEVRATKGGTVAVPWKDVTKMDALQGFVGAVDFVTTIEWPKDDEVIAKGVGLVKYTVTPAKERPCRLVLDNAAFAYDTGGKTTLEALNGGEPLAEGSHLLSVFPVDESGIAWKNAKALAQARFHVGKKKGDLPDAKAQQLIANLPDGVYDSTKGEAHNIIADFWIKNLEMQSARAPKYLNVVLTVDGPGGRKRFHQETWGPVVILADPAKGSYKVTAELEERDDYDPEDAAFTPFSRTITVK